MFLYGHASRLEAELQRIQGISIPFLSSDFTVLYFSGIFSGRCPILLGIGQLIPAFFASHSNRSSSFTRLLILLRSAFCSKWTYPTVPRKVSSEIEKVILDAVDIVRA